MPSRDFDRYAPSVLDGDNAIATPATDWYRSFSAAALKNPAIHGPISHWLTLEGSLTRALQLRCREHFHVDILQEGFARPTVEEAHTLGIPVRQNAWIREVCLNGDNTPWVLARTIIPLATLSGRGRRLRNLGRRPLGAYLFSNPQWQRGPFEIGLCHRANRHQPVAARRSRFFSGDRSLLVGEYFLPTLCP
ncbi:chorismate lyase [uncultured Marinobacter sp.]|uniref:chorismate--pyruvate lyase family protein n=1 Tax=uncultured Marinobacter sp. TaxID=187379 RepID=UPI00258B5922|nr:chorismate lyase [uncultured Marinobacter sp.]